LASGCFLAPGLLWLLARGERSPSLLLTATIMALFFLLVTTGLLIADLKRPRKFLSIILRPQWKSWLVLGSFILMAYGAVLTAVAAATIWLYGPSWLVEALYEALIALGIPLAAMAAMYTGWLFAQCEARDLWLSPQLPWHLLNQAILAGTSALLLLHLPAFELLVFKSTLALSLIADLAWFFPHELGIGHKLTPAGREAAAVITRGIFRKGFWGGVVSLGHIVPLVLLLVGLPLPAALLALGGLALYEHYFIIAGQAVPLS
jgi:formate-dependent nitrite reductase membrane component NrfD